MELTAARAEEAVMRVHIRHALAFVQILGHIVPPTRAVTLYLDELSVPSVRARHVYQRVLARIAEQELPKGSMTLIDMSRAESLYSAMGPAVEVSGGSCANTMAGVASLGGQGGFIGKVRNDQLGGIFRHDIRATGIEFDGTAATEGPPTARCLILVSPDAQRTMATYLGISVELGPEDVDHDLIRRGKVLYLEGYLWDSSAAKQAFVDAARTARAAGAKVARQAERLHARGSRRSERWPRRLRW